MGSTTIVLVAAVMVGLVSGVKHNLDTTKYDKDVYEPVKDAYEPVKDIYDTKDTYENKDTYGKETYDNKYDNNNYETGNNKYGKNKKLANTLAILATDMVVPDVIDVVPPHILNVDYGNGNVVKFGNLIDPDQINNPPVKVSWPTKPGKLYTLAFVAPDVPNRVNPFYGPINHWLVANIPGTDLYGKGVTTLGSYFAPQAELGTFIHRNVFVVFEQPGEYPLEFDDVLVSTSTTGRTNFNLRQFALTYRLGQPIAANFFNSGVVVTTNTGAKLAF